MLRDIEKENMQRETTGKGKILTGITGCMVRKT